VLPTTFLAASGQLLSQGVQSLSLQGFTSWVGALQMGEFSICMLIVVGQIQAVQNLYRVFLTGVCSDTDMHCVFSHTCILGSRDVAPVSHRCVFVVRSYLACDPSHICVRPPTSHTPCPCQPPTLADAWT